VSEPQLLMRLPALSDLPPARSLSPGFVVRLAVPADYGQLAELLAEAYGDTWDAERVAGEFSLDNGVEAIYLVASVFGQGGPEGRLPPGEIVATAAARYLPDRYPNAGYVHYVGVRVSERGKRLGEVVTRRVLVHFADAGLDQAVLETDDFRLPAVRTYLRLGFVPEPRAPGDAVRWSKVLRNVS
jgi:mycothiol synthase